MYVVCSGADCVAAVPLWELVHSSLQHLKAKNPDVSDWIMWYFSFLAQPQASCITPHGFTASETSLGFRCLVHLLQALLQLLSAAR